MTTNNPPHTPRLVMRGLLLVALSLIIVLMQNTRAFAKEDYPFYDPDFVASCGGATISLAGNENAEKVFNYFISQGYKPWQAAGIVGNMTAESGVLPQRLQGTAPDVITPADTVGNKAIGWGIVQWTPASKMINPVKSAGKDPNDIGIQVDFLWNQLEGKGPIPEKRAGDELKSTGNVEEAVLAFQGDSKVGGKYLGYERPKDQSGSVPFRTAAARDALARFGSGSATSSGASPAVSSGCGGISADGCPTSTIDESQTVNVQGIKVHPCISQELDRILTLAKTKGINLSGSGWRDPQQQIALRKQNCPDPVNSPSGDCTPPTALPGTSRHEYGMAVDFTCDGTTIPSRSSPCYLFLDQNTTLKNLPSEAWHWSADGR